MLTQPTKTSTTTAITVTPDKQICVPALSSGAIMYEVPTGRKFVGAFVSSGNYQAYINGATVLSNASAQPPFMPIVMLAGSKVNSGQSYTSWVLFGVETNA